MLYHLLFPLRSEFGALNVFGYISFRAAAAMTTALLLTMLLYPPFIRFLQARKLGQAIRDDGPQTHLVKAGTPTMGGLLILTAITLSTFLWARLDNAWVWMVLVTGLGFCAVGFLDDWGKVSSGTSQGLSGRLRLLVEFIISAAVLYVGIYVLQVHNPSLEQPCSVPSCLAPEHMIPLLSTVVPMPFFAGLQPDLGVFYLPFAAFVIVGTANAVNLTDGLDGLAIGPVMTAALTFGLLAYLVGSSAYAAQLKILHVPLAAELAVVTVTLAGAGMGFLWYNTFPASIFMGDTGSLPLGAMLGALAVFTHQEILLVLVGGVFVAETLSVIIQVVSFKTTGKRVFAMAPIHHHFEQKGWQEPKIIVRFWIISIVLALVAVMTLKLR
ncbi:MAG TPA: phospho-N-acetylmuramoyl-pentapeptide-transferase [Deltaproteobacteria bacterium]|nr:phospho-N-acetylmuramoyl-pentapeptide-transferase [Deltaproteobacteria bacterium]HCP45129.1 phospho-N-acetylmuramoyl-pentapeptide-transferase [Deltaproteobacteria bacterium]